jgi:acyl-CoA synthetase (AMP-forming)/AMP-acid ligase II
MSQITKIGFTPGESADNNVITYLKRHSENFSDRKALLWTSKASVSAWSGNPSDPIPHQSITYREFYERTNRLAGGLKKLGIQKGDAVIIFLPMSVELYQTMFAVLQLGGVAVFLDSWARRLHLGASADTVNPKAMISFEGAFQFCKEVPEIDKIPIKICAYPSKATFTASVAELEKSERYEKLQAVESEDTALITFTTGSSGRPKGANRTHQFLSAQHLALDLTIPYTEKDVDLPAFPIFSLNNLASGVTTVIPAVDIGSPTERDPEILIGQLVSCKANCSALSPSMLTAMAAYADRKHLQLSFLRRVVTGGAPISNDDLRAFKKVAPETEIWVLYGSTEVEPIAHIEAKDSLRQEAEGSDPLNGVNVGHFAEGLQYKFICVNRGPIELKNNSWKGLEVSKGEVGEIVVEGLHVCKSYFNYPEATKATKIIDGDGKVWHRTGDLGYLDSKGQVWLVGRVHNAICRGGEWLFPVKAEILLKRLPFAKNVAFLGMVDDELGEKTCAVVSAKNPEDLTKASHLSEQIRQSLQANGIPVDYALVLDEIPMDPRHHSKVEYGVLRDRLIDDGLIGSERRKVGC